MVGSIAVAFWIAQAVFAFLVLTRWSELGTRKAVTFIVLWVLAYAGLPRVGAGLYVTPVVAVLDIVLILTIFKGDVRFY
jgi:hypothetical protein